MNDARGPFGDVGRETEKASIGKLNAIEAHLGHGQGREVAIQESVGPILPRNGVLAGNGAGHLGIHRQDDVVYVIHGSDQVAFDFSPGLQRVTVIDLDPQRHPCRQRGGGPLVGRRLLAGGTGHTEQDKGASAAE